MVSDNLSLLKSAILQYNDLESKSKYHTNDDRLLLKANKTNPQTKRKLPLKIGWQSFTSDIKYKKGVLSPVGYSCRFNGGVSFIGVSEYELLKDGEKIIWYPYFAKSVDGFEGKDISVVLKHNDFMIQLEKLKSDFGSRYRGVLNVLMDLESMGVVDYKGKAKTDRHKQESLRNVMNNWFKVSEYEYNYQFVGAVGLKIFNDLKTHKSCREVIGNTTLYFQGYKKTRDTVKKIKMYNVTAKKEKRDNNKKSDTYKIEVTLCRKFFKDNDIDLRKLLTFDSIIELPEIKKDLEKNFKKFYSSVSSDTRALINRGFKMGASEVMTEISNPDRTYYSVVREQSKMKMQIEGLIKQMNETSEMTIENRKMIERLIAN